MNAEPLISTLIDFTREAALFGGRLIVGGGFGLYLRQIDLQRHPPAQTLLPGEMWPPPRGTEDIDILLPSGLVCSLEKMQALRGAIDRLGFEPVPEAKFLQFDKPWQDYGRIKIDLLTGPLPDTISRAELKINRPRVRPRGKVELHAYLTDEALDFESALQTLTVEKANPNAAKARAVVHLPQPFTFLVMKLHAVADRLGDSAADFGRHHALDIYRVAAMLAEDDYAQVQRCIERHAASEPIIRAREIVAEYFSSATAMGVVRIREHPLFTERMDIGQLIAALGDLFH